MLIDNTDQGQQTNGATDSVNTQPEDTPNEVLLAGKYKSVEDLEKGYKESTKFARELNSKVKTLETSIPKAPEQYEFDFNAIEGLEGLNISIEDPDIQAMIPVFKELNISQDQASRLIEAHVKNMVALSESNEQIREKLGSEADVILSKIQEFNNKLPLEDQQILQSLTDTSASIDFLYRHLIGKELSTPGLPGTLSLDGKSAAELREEAFKYKRDNANSIGFNKAQQEKYDSMLKAAIIAKQNEAKK